MQYLLQLLTVNGFNCTNTINSQCTLLLCLHNYTRKKINNNGQATNEQF